MAMFSTTSAVVLAIMLATDAAGAATDPVPPPAAAPVERQLPFDDAGKLLELDGARAREVGLVEDGSFKVVRLFQSGDSHVLELELSREGRLERVRRPVTPEQLAEAKSKLASGPMAPEPRQDARLALLGTTTVFGFTLYGLAASTLLSDRFNVPVFLLTGAASVAVPWLLTRNTEVTWGETGLAFYGATRGAGYGLLASEVVGRDFANSSGAAVLAAGASAAALTGGFLWARYDGLDSGEAHLVGVGGDAGLFLGFTLGSVAITQLKSLDAKARLLGLASIGGSALGLAGGRWLSGNEPHTFGDAEVLRTAGLVGVLGGVAAASYLPRKSFGDPTLFVGGLLGSAVGLTVGELLVRDRQLSTGDGLLIDLGTVAGAIAAALTGFAVLPALTDERLDDLAPGMLTFAALGAAAGYGASFALLAPAKGERPEESAAQLHLSISPVALMSGRGRTEAPAPIVTLQYTPAW